jgi:hypothetical protein
VYSWRDKKEMRRIVKMKIKHRHTQFKDNPYRRAWEEYLEKKAKEGPEGVVVFSY